jgi:AcrR family transcriptional regulator
MSDRSVILRDEKDMTRFLNPERKEKYLDSALKLFVNKGVENTTTAEIAREAGTATGTLFLYFPTKQALLDELILKIGKAQSDFIRTILNPSQTAQETFYAIWQGSVHWFLENREAYLYIQQVRDSGIISEKAVQESAKFLNYYFDAIQKGLEERSIKPYPVELIGGFLYQDIIAIMSIPGLSSDSGSQDEAIQMGFDIFWNGIRTEMEDHLGDIEKPNKELK